MAEQNPCASVFTGHIFSPLCYKVYAYCMNAMEVCAHVNLGTTLHPFNKVYKQKIYLSVHLHVYVDGVVFFFFCMHK